MPRYRQAIRRTQKQVDEERRAASAPVDRKRLQARAKELGIPANQSNDALTKAIGEAE